MAAEHRDERERSNEWLTGCRRALEHPLRQVLFTLLCHRPATAHELKGVVGEPLKKVDYHLRVLVRRECLVAESHGSARSYRVDPRATLLIPTESPEVGRILMMSLLDAAWTALGRSPEGTALAPRWETFSFDVAGLKDALAVIAEALEEVKVIAAGSEDGQGEAGEDVPMHTLVVVASLLNPPPGKAGA